jgi:hypothetical protein
MRTLAAALIIGSVAPLTACQATQPNETAITPGKTNAAELAAIKQPERRRESERVSVEARVTKLGGGEAVAVTRGEIETERTAVFETKKAGEPGESRLTLEVQPRGKGVYAVRLDWQETTNEGRSITFSPTLAVVEGEEGSAEIAWSDGDGRRISLKLEKPVAVAPAVATR